MALISKCGVVVADDVSRDGARAIFDDAEIAVQWTSGRVTGHWMAPSADGEDWFYTDMTPQECKAYCDAKGIRGWAR